MLFSTICNPLNHKQYGFTLIELLVVLVIISLFASTLLLTVSISPEKDINSEYQRLIRIMKLAQDEAMLKGDLLGLHLYENGYFFSRNVEEKWQIILDDPYFLPHFFSSNMSLTIEIDNELVPLRYYEQIQEPELQQDIEFKENEPPPIFFLSSGEMNDFKITLQSNLKAPQNAEIRYAEIIGYESGQLITNNFPSDND